jgi:predicted nucleic acid-binding protein
MSDKPAFFDTNMLLYAAHPSDPKRDIVRSLLFNATGVISVQVLNEFVHVARRKLKQDWDKIEKMLADFAAFFVQPIAVTFDTHLLAVRIAKRYGYSIYDALIIAAATEASCSVLYSEDMQNGQRIGSVTIRNPFIQ